MTASRAPAGQRYLALIVELIDRLRIQEWPNIEAAAEVVADALQTGASIHAFGTGHSHILAEELFYRAGGLVKVKPILFEGLMLHESARLSTSLERMPGLATALLEDHPIAAGDVVIVASNSGGNAVSSELAEASRSAGAAVIAITSLRHAKSTAVRPSDAAKLHEIADVVIDNGGGVGDAAIAIDGYDRKVAPTSTVIGAAILNAIVAGAVERLVTRGAPPDVYTSSNVEGGDEANARFLRAGAER
jgi:uncharacterized phosphosugar-binding protein